MATPTHLTRDELSRFLPDRKSILAFEDNFQQTSDNSDAAAAAQAAADNALVAAAAAQASANAAQMTADAAVPKTTLITAGDGLTGGGALNTDLVLSVGAGPGITVNPDNIELALITASGVYTPILTNTLNLDASTAYQCQYLRVGDVVTVSGRVDIDPTASAQFRLGISLPIPSDIGAENDCCGCGGTTTLNGAPAIRGDAVNDRAEMVGTAVDTLNYSQFFTFTYLII